MSSLCMLSHSVLSDCGTLWTVSPRLLCPWDSPSKNTALDCHAPLQGDLPDTEIRLLSLMSPALAGRFFTTNVTWEFKS